MKHEYHHISKLYESYPRLYNQIANDRNFSSEIEFLFDRVEFQPKSSLEAFAGEGRHSVQMSERGVNAYAVDRTNGMRSPHLLDGNYIVGELPEVLSMFENQQKFDILLAMRFGIGHLNPSQLNEFFQRSKRILNYPGLLGLEIHTNLRPGDQFQDLDIHERKLFSEEYGDVSCTWPFGEISWEGGIAHMPVKISFSKPKRKDIYFLAPEYIYGVGELTSKLRSLNFKVSVEEFSPYSCMLLARTTDTNPI